MKRFLQENFFNLSRVFTRLDWNKLSWMIAVEAGAIIVIASFFLPGGDDIYRFYLPFAGGCLNCGFVPYFAYWVLWPLSLIPPRLVWPVWTLISVGGFIGLCKVTKTNPALVILSFPALGQFWLGQIDIIICLGLALGLLAQNPYLRGGGLVLAMIKPQLAGLAVFLLLTHQSRQNAGKVLVIPFLAIILSFIVFGLSWPIDWAINSLTNLPVHVWRLASRDVWPYGIVIVLTLFVFTPLRPRFEATLLISALGTPFFGVYSYIIFLLFRAPWWSLPLSYAWVLFYPLWGNEAMRTAWLLPVGLLAYLFYRERKQRKENLVKTLEVQPFTPE